MTTYSDVLGNYISADEMLQMFAASGSDNLAGWIEQQSAELWGAEHDPDLDWAALAADLQRSAAAATLGRSTSPAKAAAARENGRKGGRPMSPKTAIKVLAVGASHPNIDKARQVLAETVLEASEYGDPNVSLDDWISAGDYTGDETVESIAAEWDEGRAEMDDD